jgi:hypothetical protein
MKLNLVLMTFLLAGAALGQSGEQLASKPAPHKKLLQVEVACGLCQFEMQSDECALAVRMNGKLYFIDGTNIDAHGDAHAKDGFCNATRKAAVQGEVVNNRFKVNYFRLLPIPKDSTKTKNGGIRSL